VLPFPLHIKITGFGLYLPPKIETSAELAPKIGKTERWINTRTGVLEKRISEIDVDEMGAISSKEAIGNGVPPDLIINASAVGKQAIPDTSVFIQKQLGFDNIPSFTIHATCLSFIVAFQTAANFIHNGVYKRILIVSSERGTRGRNINEPESAALLGDGSSAIMVEAPSTEEDSKLLYWNMHTWPSGAELTELRGGGTNLPPHEPKMKIEDNLFTMKGPQVYKLARKKVSIMIEEMLDECKLTHDEIDWVIPHQASNMAVRAYAKYGGFDEDRVVNIVAKTGNCVAASLPMALTMQHQKKPFKRGDKILMIGTGAGLSAASILFKF